MTIINGEKTSMELLEEYQNALKKIATLEEQIEDIKEYIDTARHNLHVVCNEFSMRAEGLAPESEVQKAVVTSTFLLPKRMLELADKTLELAFMDKEKRKTEDSKLKVMMIDIIRDKIHCMDVIDRTGKKDDFEF